MGETIQSVLSLKNAFDFLKKKVLFALNVYKKRFVWLVFLLGFFRIYLFFIIFVFI